MSDGCRRQSDEVANCQNRSPFLTAISVLLEMPLSGRRVRSLEWGLPVPAIIPSRSTTQLGKREGARCAIGHFGF